MTTSKQWREPPGEPEPHLEDVREGEREPRDQVDELLPDLDWEDSATDEGKRQEWDRLQELERHSRLTGGRERLRESTQDEDATGECPRSEERAEEASPIGSL